MFEKHPKKTGAHWIQTYKGGVYDYGSAEGSTRITIGTLAHSLAHTNRFLSHSRFRWTVAEHSLLVAEIGCQLLRSPEEIAFVDPYLMIHDAHEAFLGDMPAPLKRFIAQEYGFDFKELERSADVRIRKDLGLKVATPVWVKEIIQEADVYALKLERDAFMASDHEWVIDDIILPAGIDIKINRELPPQRMARKFQNALLKAIKGHQDVADRF